MRRTCTAALLAGRKEQEQMTGCRGADGPWRSGQAKAAGLSSGVLSSLHETFARFGSSRTESELFAASCYGQCFA